MMNMPMGQMGMNMNNMSTPPMAQDPSAGFNNLPSHMVQQLSLDRLSSMQNPVQNQGYPGMNMSMGIPMGQPMMGGNRSKNKTSTRSNSNDPDFFFLREAEQEK